ncbi:hypothetical protein FAUST_5319 [Fusarium austroamericanum]|uniref:Uncharacterized protein n=1 Tax=Fusarium austroamericanum TaxID=282268 RepID=A0AAN6C1I6_FUSAU|nr:hypothetical protein FAUST_5319 [Fusarium austroamericanum]
MRDNIKEVDGTLVTDTDVGTRRPLQDRATYDWPAEKFAPPSYWTNVYEDMGGDVQWDKDGDVEILVKGYGLSGTVKPLFSMQPYTGESISLLELSGSYYLYNAIERSLCLIVEPNDLATIVSTLDDEDRGLAGLEIEPL